MQIGGMRILATDRLNVWSLKTEEMPAVFRNFHPERATTRTGGNPATAWRTKTMAEFFRARPPAQPVRQAIPVCRSTTKKWGLTVDVIALSDRVTCAPTHHRGRTQPCMIPFGKTCESCEAGWEPRWVGYIAAWHIRTKQKVLLEITAGAADLLSAHAEKIGSIRGELITLSRSGDRAKGPLQIRWQHSNTAEEQLPQTFDVEEVLMRLWRVNQAIAQPQTKPAPIPPTIDPADPRVAGDYAADEFRHAKNGRQQPAATRQ